MRGARARFCNKRHRIMLSGFPMYCRDEILCQVDTLVLHSVNHIPREVTQETAHELIQGSERMVPPAIA